MSGNILKSGYVCFNSFRVQNEAQFLDNYGENMGLPHDKKVTGGGIENRKPLAEKGNTTGRRESCNKGRCVEKSTLFQYRRKIVADRGKNAWKRMLEKIKMPVYDIVPRTFCLQTLLRRRQQ